MNTKNTALVELYKSSLTVFNLPDLALLWNQTNTDLIKAKINYYVKTGKILSLRRGIYAKPEYDPLELATKIYTPAYISLETVLAKHGVIFQYSSQITAISYLSREIEVAKSKITFKRIRQEILTNLSGIENAGNYHIASAERAFLDSVYLYGPIYFDNLSSLNWETCQRLAKIYNQKSLLKYVASYARQHQT